MDDWEDDDAESIDWDEDSQHQRGCDCEICQNQRGTIRDISGMNVCEDCYENMYPIKD